MSLSIPAHSRLMRPPIVLCVDDDHAIRILYWQSLWSQGYLCMTCESADAALEAVRQLPVAVAILDYDMPTVTGTELAQKLRAMQPDLPILLMSGRTDLRNLALEDFDEVCCKSSPISEFFCAVSTLAKGRP
jgi:DNA-binding NtrC family response regulator